ncbi:hypothetical protein CKO23_22565 [Thiocystis violacea]|nr:hypothetical protein [Thiocystis violacea]
MALAVQPEFKATGVLGAGMWGAIVRHVDEATDAAKKTPRAARRQAMRDAGIPTSQQPVAQRSAAFERPMEHPQADSTTMMYPSRVAGQLVTRSSIL